MTAFSDLPSDLRALLEQEKLEALAEFAAGAGHEMNNPLAVISGRAQLLLRNETDPERRRELAIIHTQALRVHEMIADLMLFARPPQAMLATVDLTALCRRLLAELAAEAAERKIAFAAQIEESLQLAADATQLAVALRALLDNALEAIGREGQITLTCRAVADPADPAMIELLVSDSGPGISPDVRRHLFDPYFSGRPAGRGLGLGLCKCWRIVTNHGGQIDVDSEPGQGATFRIRLPKGSRTKEIQR